VNTVPMHLLEQIAASVIVSVKPADIDGKPPRAVLPQDFFPERKDIVHYSARQAIDDFHAEFICIIPDIEVNYVLIDRFDLNSWLCFLIFRIQENY
jgi:hypothetical protein